MWKGTKMTIPEENLTQKYKLVNRLANEIYFDNLDYEKGVELLHTAEKENKMLITIDYVYRHHHTEGSTWQPR